LIQLRDASVADFGTRTNRILGFLGADGSACQAVTGTRADLATLAGATSTPPFAPDVSGCAGSDAYDTLGNSGLGLEPGFEAGFTGNCAAFASGC